jgi:prepilin-type N-terminal cleavage/methylation domain-containing protein
MNTSHQPGRDSGFTFIEALMTIAILGILASVVVSAFSNAGTDSARIMARQQQSALQAAVNAWVNSDTNRVDVINAVTGTAKLRTIAEIQTAYNSTSGNLARFNLIAPYLDSNTSAYFTTYSTATQVLTDALNTSKQYIAFPDWTNGSYPQVTLNAKP